MTQQAPAEVYEKHYDEQADYWDWLYSASEDEISIYAYHFRRRRDVVLEYIAAHPFMEGARFLDAGCGPGAYSDPLLEMGYEVYGFDQSSEMVKRAKGNVTHARKEHAHFDVGSLDDIQFEDDFFDVITNIAVLMYVGDPQKCVSEISRVLKPGGLAVITVDNKADFADRIDVIARFGRLLGRLTGKKKQTAEPSDGEPGFSPQCFSPKEMRDMFEKAGLEQIDTTSVGFAPIKVNNKRLFADKTDIGIDRKLSVMRRWGFSKNWGYTYICVVRKPG